MNNQTQTSSRRTMLSFYVVLDREMKRLHEFLKDPKLEGVMRVQAQEQLGKLHRSLYRNTLSDYGLDETKLRALAPVLEIKGESIK
jgi:hypothetical protein